MSSDFIRAHLSPDFEQALRPLMTQLAFPKHARLYRYGATAEGLYLVEAGAVRVLVPGSDNQSQLLEVAGEGVILGLSETLSSETYRATVEADEPVTASFLARKDFLTLLNGNHEFSMEVVRLLSESLHGLYHRFRSVSAHPGRPRRRMPDEGMN